MRRKQGQGQGQRECIFVTAADKPGLCDKQMGFSSLLPLSRLVSVC